jgi:PAS domain S-box-containing protein
LVSEEKYRTVVENAHEAIVIAQGDKVVFWNPSALEMFGYSAEEFASISFVEFIHPADRRKVVEEYQKRLSGEKAKSRYTIRILTKDGRQRWIKVGSTQIEWEGKPASLASISDITELVVARDRLRKAQAIAGIGFMDLDLRTGLISLGPETSRIFGLDPGTTMAKADFVNQFVHPDDLKHVEEGLQLALEGKRPYDIDHRIVWPDGTTTWVHAQAELRRDSEGHPRSMVGWSSDITRRKLAEQDAQEQREALARLDRTAVLGQVAGGIAHELTQPLTGILSTAQACELLINKGGTDLAQMLEMVSGIADDAKRAGEVIHNLLDLYGDQSGGTEVVDVGTIITETLRLLHSEFVVSNVAVTEELPETALRVEGNRVQLQQVLVNLILNGIEAMAKVEEADRRLCISSEFTVNEVSVSVEDRGDGIDPDRIEGMFEPFATWKPGGTGMGLAVTKSIIDAHDGRVWAENRAGGGARVTFTIPRLEEEP